MRNYREIVLRNADLRFNPEMGTPGVAVETINLRERDNMLVPVGNPADVATLEDGERLLLVDVRGDTEYFITTGDYRLWLHGMRCNGVFSLVRESICDIEGEVSQAFSLGDFVGVNDSNGRVYIHFENGHYSLLNLDDMIPEIILSAGESAETVNIIPEYTFKGTYTQWQKPLTTSDQKEIASRLATAYKAAKSEAEAHGGFIQPIIARYLVRLWGDSILWVSAPVIVGNGVQNGGRVSFNVNLGDGKFESLSSGELRLKSFGLAMTVVSGNSAEWDKLIKSVEVYYAAPQLDLVKEEMEYRCEMTQTGTRYYYLTAQLLTEEPTAAVSQLANTGSWKLIAVINDIAQLRQGKILGVGIAKSTDLTGGALSDKTWIAYNDGIHSAEINSTELARTTRHICRSKVSACNSVNGGRVYSGGGVSALVNRWKPVNYLDAELAAVPANACVVLTLRSQQGYRRIVSSYRLEYSDLSLNPLLAFPFDDAVSVEIMINRGGITYSFTSHLLTCDSGEYAYCAMPDLKSPVLTSNGSGNYVVPQNMNYFESCNSMMCVSRNQNPLVWENEIEIGDSSINAIGFALRPVSANIFGRFPLYAFTSRGIFAVSTETALAMPRRLSQLVVANENAIAQSPSGIYFLAENNLYILSGANVTEVSKYINSDYIAWTESFSEVWSCTPSRTSIYLTGGRRYSRSLRVEYFCRSTNEKYFAITSTGLILDISTETDCATDIYYLSHPFAAAEQTTKITWNIFGNDLNITATLFGDNGAGCHGSILSRIKAKGNLNAPLPVEIRSPRRRVHRLEIIGTLSTGSTIRPTQLTAA